MDDENKHYSVRFNVGDIEQDSDEGKVFLKQFGEKRVAAINRLRDRIGTVEDAKLLATGADPLVTDMASSMPEFIALDEDAQIHIRITDVLAHEGGAEILVASVTMTNILEKYPDRWREKLAPATVDGEWMIGHTITRGLQRLGNYKTGMRSQSLVDLKIAADLLDATSYQFSMIQQLETAQEQLVSNAHIRQTAEYAEKLRREIARIAALEVPSGISEEEQIANYFIGLKASEQVAAHILHITTVVDKNGGAKNISLPENAGRQIKLWAIQGLIDYMETTILDNNVIERQSGRDKKGPILEAMLLIDSFMIMVSQGIDKHVVIKPSTEGQDDPRINYPRLKRGIDLIAKNLLTQQVEVYNAKNKTGLPDSRRNTGGYAPEVKVLVEGYQPSTEELRDKLRAYRYILSNDFQTDDTDQTIDDLALQKAKEIVDELK